MCVLTIEAISKLVKCAKMMEGNIALITAAFRKF
jgi:hypothetical protein